MIDELERMWEEEVEGIIEILPSEIMKRFGWGIGVPTRLELSASRMIPERNRQVHRLGTISS
jgi:hypothetical protein